MGKIEDYKQGFNDTISDRIKEKRIYKRTKIRKNIKKL